MRAAKTNIAGVLIAAVALAACTTPGGPAPQTGPTATTQPPSPVPGVEPSSESAVSSSAPPTTEPTEEATATPPDPRMAHDDAASLTDTLVAAEQALRDLTDQLDEQPDATRAERIRDERAQWAWVQQAAYRQLVARPAWDDEVRAAVPDELRPAFDRNLLAGRRLRELTAPRDHLPADWQIVEPPRMDVLLDAYRTAAAEFGVDWSYLAAIHLTETRMGRIRGDSHAGAQGPMQFMPATWDAYGQGDVNDPHDAIAAAARYLVAHGAPGNMRSALYAYNHSNLYVDATVAYAEVMQADPRAYAGYHGWQVYYRLESGDMVLPVGWSSGDPAVTATSH